MPAPDYCPCNQGSFEQRLDALRDLVTAPPTASRSGPLTAQRRGYCLEALLSDLLEHEGLEPRSSYNEVGEQIDGSFVVNGRAFLLEAKWFSKDEIPASGIYAFKGKVDGKLVGTIGLFLAMGPGFSADSVDALARGKDLNVLLADDEDLTTAVSSGGSFGQMIRTKVRAAVDTGAVYAPYRVGVNGVRGEPASRTRVDSGRRRIAFAVEGPRDTLIVGQLGRQVLSRYSSDLEIETHPGLGVKNAVLLAGSLREQYGPLALVGVVVDGNGETPEQRKARLGSDDAIRGRQVPIVVATPTLEQDWLDLTLDRRGSTMDQIKQRLASGVDTDELRTRSESFAYFARLLESQAAAVASDSQLSRDLTTPAG